MSEKRRDNRNRILREGEYQRKDGRYRFRYIDEDGKEKNVYSWRLDKNDPMPKGKKREPSLREKEKQIEADLFDRIVTNGGNYTVLELVEKYVSLKTGVRHNTVAGYKTVINMLKKESFGNLRIDKVRLSDAKAWLIKLQQIDGRGYSSIHSIRGVLRPAFQMAVDDDLLRKNPFEFELASVIVNDSVTREAITRKQQRDLLKFIQEDKHFSRYYDAIYILFHTGLRISEFCGLTVSEIEFGEMRIKVDHQLQRTVQMQYVIEEPKTDKGIRYVPMTEAVAACFRRIIANRIMGMEFSERLKRVVDEYNNRRRDEAFANEVLDDVAEQLAKLLEELKLEKDSFKAMGIDYEEKAFYDILKAVAKKYGFEYPEDKMIELSKRIKVIVDDKAKYTDWSTREDIKATLQVDLILLLDEFDYPPVTIDDVYKEVLEQAENFKKYAG